MLDQSADSSSSNNNNNNNSSSSSSSSSEVDTTALWGWIILLATYVWFIVGMYAMVVSKLLPDTGSIVLDWIKYDWYYCFLIPVMIPVSVVFIVVNWMGMKLFRHN